MGTTGSSGDVTASATGGNSGDVSAYGPGPGTAYTGNGGSAGIAASSGNTGDASAISSCTIVFTATDMVIDGDLILRCYAIAQAQSGTSGPVSGSATGGTAGDAYTGTFGGDGPAAIGTESQRAFAGSGGGAAVVGGSGSTGNALALASCAFDVHLTRVVINGQLQTLCIVVAHAVSGSSGDVTGAAVSGSAGIGVSGANLLVGTWPQADGAVSGTGPPVVIGTSGRTGSASATVTCTSFLQLDASTIRGGVLSTCDAPGALSGGSSTSGAAGVIFVAVSGGSGAAPSAQRSIPDALAGPFAASGAGGSAIIRAASGSTGNATAIATCSITVTASNVNEAQSLLLGCLSSAVAMSGNSGSVTAVAAGGDSGSARAGLLLVTTVISVPAPETGASPDAALHDPQDSTVSNSGGKFADVAATRAVLPTTATNSVLANTGADPGGLATGGAAALLLGAGLLVGARHRRRESE